MNQLWDFESHWYYFVRYPLGAGGNHLANLLSLDEDFEPRIGQQRLDYFDVLKTTYRQDQNHLRRPRGTALISDVPAQTKLTSPSGYPKSVHIGHSASFVWAKELLQPLMHKRFISLQFNTSVDRDFVRKRERKIFQTDTLANDYYAAELAHYYNTWFSGHDACDDDVNLAIPCHRLGCVDITDLIDEINIKFQLHISVKSAQELHYLWLDLIEKT